MLKFISKSRVKHVIAQTILWLIGFFIASPLRWLSRRTPGFAGQVRHVLAPSLPEPDGPASRLDPAVPERVVEDTLSTLALLGSRHHMRR